MTTYTSRKIDVSGVLHQQCNICSTIQGQPVFVPVGTTWNSHLDECHAGEPNARQMRWIPPHHKIVSSAR